MSATHPNVRTHQPMMKRHSFALLFLSLLLVMASQSVALDRQPNADYHARREALARRAAGLVVLFAPMADGEDLYGFRQEDNFYYLSGVSEPGTALLIASALEAKGESPAQPYMEILFLPPRNLAQEKWHGPKLGPRSEERRVGKECRTQWWR